MKEYNIGLYEKAMPGSLSFHDKLLLAMKAGYDRVEISVDETEEKLNRLYSAELQEEILTAVRITGIPVYTMCLSGHRKYPLGSMNLITREKSLDIMKYAIEFSAKLGVKIIQLAGYDVFYEESNEATRKYFAENLRKSVEIAAKYGIILAFETMETPFMNTIGKAMKYVTEINSPYLQIYPDIGNIRNATEDYIGDIESGRGHIAAVHLKETVEGVFRDMEYGQGRVDFDSSIKALVNQGIRMFTCEFWYDGKTEPIEYIRRNKEYIDKKFPVLK
jgi:L-ribulose-5-phosphate 3-epimerase